MPTYSVTYKYFKFCALLLLSFTHALLSSADIWSTDHRYLKCIYRMSRFQFDSKCSQTIINIATFCVGHIPATCMKLPWFIWRPILFETTSIVLYVCKSFHHSRNNPAATTTRCSSARPVASGGLRGLKPPHKRFEPPHQSFWPLKILTSKSTVLPAERKVQLDYSPLCVLAEFQ